MCHLYMSTESILGLCVHEALAITGKGARNSSFWIHTLQCPMAQRKASLQCFISSLFAAFPGIIVLCSKMDNRLTVPSVPREIQPSLILGTPKILAWNFAVAGARGKCVLQSTSLLQPVPKLWCSAPLLVAHGKLAVNSMMVPLHCFWPLDCVYRKEE